MRPTAYSVEITTAICDRIAGGETLRAVCADEGMPAKSTVMLWLRDRPEFATDYAVACEFRAIAMGEDIIDIADEAEGDDAVAVARARLKIDARKWAMSKAAPKKYGEKVELQHSGMVATGIDLSGLNNEEKDVLLLLLEKAEAARAAAAGSNPG